MEIQILHPFAVQLEPRLDVCVFRVACGGIRISLLDFSRAFPIDMREHWLKRDAKNGTLRSPPAAPVRERIGELEDFTGKLHSKIDELYGNCLGCQPRPQQTMLPFYKVPMISRKSRGPR